LIPKETSVWIPLTIQTAEEPLLQITKAKDEFLYDNDGNTYIDGIASWWTSIYGHCHPKIIEAITQQALQLDHVMLAGFIHEPAESLAKKLIGLASGDFCKVFYSDNGSNAIEIALKMAVQYFQNRSSSKEVSKSKFITFSASYHGDSIGAMNVSGVTYFNRIFSKLRFPTKEFDAPNCHQCKWKQKPETCQVECLGDLEKELATRSEEYAGIVIEPLVFGASGMIFYDEKVLKKLRALASDHDVLLILDEIFTGMGRTGEYFAFQKAGIVPDLVALAKGLTGGALPLAATLVSSKIYESFLSSDPYSSFFHAHTMTGNPIACSAGVASVDILVSDGLSRVRQLEKGLMERLDSLKEKFPDRILSPRVLGAICAFDLPEVLGEDEYLNPVGKKLRFELIKYGVILRPLGSTVYISPSYFIAEASLDQIFEALSTALLSL